MYMEKSAEPLTFSSFRREKCFYCDDKCKVIISEIKHEDMGIRWKSRGLYFDEIAMYLNGFQIELIKLEIFLGVN